MAASGQAMVPGMLDVYDRNQEATIYVGNVDQKIDEEVLWELFLHAGPLQAVTTPKDKITGTHMGFAFVEFKNEEDADYACKIMNMVKLFNKPIRCTKATADKKTADVGANLFVGNLDTLCDDKLLYDTFASFGQLLFAKVMRDPDTNESRGFGFVSYDTFEGSDAAMAAMNGQFLCNAPITVSYAYKKDTRGERHGDATERLIASHKPSQIPNEYIPAPTELASAGKGLALPDGPAPMLVGRTPGVPPPIPAQQQKGAALMTPGGMPMGMGGPPPLPGGGPPGGKFGMPGGPPPFPPGAKGFPPGPPPPGGKQWGKGW
ncbi:unnamed protein product [Amoebophrya sp. A25]|nr:unnamed protein product [Amoebophrya sp. A25]|eukprot:GSA25T00026577001.1